MLSSISHTVRNNLKVPAPKFPAETYAASRFARALPARPPRLECRLDLSARGEDNKCERLMSSSPLRGAQRHVAASAATNQMRGFKTAVLGAAGGIGQVLCPG